MTDLQTNLLVFATLSLIVALSEYLVRTTALKHIGSALLVIILAGIVSNCGIIPTSSTPDNPVAAYDVIFGVVTPVSIFWLLLQVNLREVLAAGFPMLSMFLAGSVATTAGAVVAVLLVGGGGVFGGNAAALGGMFAGTYTGGSVNFNAVALHYDVMRDGVLFGGAIVVDNNITAIWISVTLIVPRVWRRRSGINDEPVAREVILGIDDDTESMHPIDFGLTIGLGLGCLWISETLSGVFEDMGIVVPSILVITTIALLLAQFRFIARLRGPRSLGMFAVYLFLSVIGAYCDFGALAGIGELAVALVALTVIIVAIHGVVTFGLTALFRVDPAIACVASQANVGGGTSALALARSLGRNDLVLPAVLVGSLGNALGTYLGFWVAGILPGLMG